MTPGGASWCQRQSERLAKKFARVVEIVNRIVDADYEASEDKAAADFFEGDNFDFESKPRTPSEERKHEVSMDKWARSYDALNGAPESMDDR